MLIRLNRVGFGRIRQNSSEFFRILTVVRARW